jgi:Uma2 family endonuclease
MAIDLKLGPTDHGRPMSLDEFCAGEFEKGHKYELIDGSLYVSPEANLPEDWVEQWLCDRVKAYARRHAGVIDFVTNKARVFVPGRAGETCPEPDLAAFRNFPKHRPIRLLRWQDVSPLLVGEVLHEGDPLKDLERNVELYFQVPSIKEYWVIDMRTDPDQPSMIVFRRHGKKWRVLEVAPGESYATKLLPGFKLRLDPHR